MQNPALTKCGHTFNRKDIFEWLDEKRECPVCRTSLQKNEVYPNYALRNIIISKNNSKN